MRAALFFKTLAFAVLLIINALQQANAGQSHPQKVISLAPHITEMLYSAGAGNKLVGVVEYSDYPPAAQDKPVIGGYHAINIEKILELDPDIIFAWRGGNRYQDLAKLEQLGFKIHYSNPQKLEDIGEEIHAIGELLGTQTAADQVAEQLKWELEQISKRYAKRTKISAFYQIWNRPLMTINGKQFISQAMALCGAENIFYDLPLLAAEVNIESLLARNPQVILLGGEQSTQQKWLQDWQKIPQLRAVQHKQVYLVNADRYQRPTERFIMSIDALCQQIDQARQHQAASSN